RASTRSANCRSPRRSGARSRRVRKASWRSRRKHFSPKASQAHIFLCHPALPSLGPPELAQHRPSFIGGSLANPAIPASQRKEVPMRKLLIVSAAAAAAALAASPAAAQIYVGVGASPYGYGYSPYSYGYSYPSYGYSPYAYSYSPYGYGYSYPSYSYGYRSYGYRSSYYCKPRRHHRNGVVWYTRGC